MSSSALNVSSSPTLKRALHKVGRALGLIGIAFIGFRLHQYAAQINFDRFDLHNWTMIGALALIYGASNLMLVLAWRQLLNAFGVAVSVSWALRIYGLSQLARYIPGNIFHLAGRQTLGLAAGLPGLALLKSTVWELGVISVTGALFGLLALPLVFPEISVTVTTVAFIGLLFIAAIATRYLIGPSTAKALGWQSVFLFISGVLFVATLAQIVPLSLDSTLLTTFCGAYVIAWLAGMVTPGAPAGLGIRELVLLMLLGSRVAEADLLLAVVLGRVVTVLGDVLFFLYASLKKVEIEV